MGLRKRIAVTVALCAILSGSAASAKSVSIAQAMREAGFKHEDASWTAVSTHTDEKGKSSTTQSKAWLSGDMYRLEAVNAQDGKPVVFLDDGKNKYVYMPDEKKAVKITPEVESTYGQMMSADIIAESARQRKQAKKTGAERIEGKKCAIYEYQTTIKVMSSTIKGDVKEWVWEKENFPLKSIMKTPRQKLDMGFMTTEMPAAETTTLIKDLKLGKPIKKSLFALPPGTRVETPDTSSAGGYSAPSNKTKKKSAKPEPAAQDEIPADVKDMMKKFF